MDTKNLYSLNDFDLNDISEPSPSEFTNVEVKIDPTDLLQDFSSAFYYELFRTQDRLVDKVEITSEELNDYFLGILYLRILDVEKNNKFKKFESQILMPAWISFAISQIGEVIDTDYGFKFVPTMDFDKLDIDALMKTASKLKYFQDAGVELLSRAFPRTTDGDPNFMTLAVIKGEVRSYHKDNDPLSIYLSAFLDSTIKEQNTLSSLYRISYQDVDYVGQVLKTTGGLIK